MRFLAMLQRRQTADGFSCLFLREAQLVQALQVQPKFGCRPKEMCKSQSRIARNRASSVQDFSHTIGWNPELPRKLSSTHAELFEFFRQMLARVNCRNCHKILLVVVNDLHICRSRRTRRPLEADPPLVVDTNAVLPLSVALQGFKSVAGQRTQIHKLDSCF